MAVADGWPHGYGSWALLQPRLRAHHNSQSGWLMAAGGSREGRLWVMVVGSDCRRVLRVGDGGTVVAGDEQCCKGGKGAGNGCSILEREQTGEEEC